MTTSRRRVLHLIDTGGPGGAETIFLQLLRRLPSTRWESLAVVPWENDWLHDALLEVGIRPVVIPTHGSFDLRFLRQLQVSARSFGAELIQTHLASTAFYGSLLGRLLCIPSVSTFHGPADLPEGLRFEGVKLRLLDRPEGRLVMVSEGFRDWFLRRTGMPGTRTRVVKNGIDHEAYAPPMEGERALRRELLGDGDGILVGAVGNVRASKDYGTLLRAAAHVIAASPIPVRFVVAGHVDPGLQRHLERVHGELGLGEDFRFLGFHPDAPTLFHALDIYVLSSSAEGFSLSTVEAMASGRPVVATRCGGPEELVVPDKTGILVPPRDPAALAGALLRLVGDPGERRRLGSEAKVSATRSLSLDAMVKGYEDVYHELLPARRAEG